MRMKKVLSLLLSVIMVIGSLPVVGIADGEAPTVDITTGLIAYYNFEGDAQNPSSIRDASGNGNDARVLNTVIEGDGSWWSQSVNNILTVSNGIATFPGMTQSFWSANNGAALKLPNGFNEGVESFSFSAWINADGSYTYANNMTRFFDFGNLGSGSNNPYNSIFARYTPGSGNLRIQDRSINKYNETTISSRPFTDSWGLFTFVYEKNADTGFYETQVYVNGEVVPEFTTTDVYTRALSDLGTIDDVTNGFFIGRTVWLATNQNSTDNPDFKGQMDEIRIYNRALTQEQVKYLYDTTSPVGELKMDSFEADDVTTMAGDYPLLPETVDVIYNTGAVKTEYVTWDIITSDLLAHEGAFTVNGVTDAGNEVYVKVVVIKKNTSTLAQGLVAYYSFDNDGEFPETIIDSSGNGNNASVHNVYQEISNRGNTITVDKKVTVTDGVMHLSGSSIGEDHSLTGRNDRNRYFNGASIRMPNNIGEGVEEFTYSAWIYADTDYRYSGSIQRFFDFGTGDRDSMFYRYVPTTGESRFQDRGVGSGSDDENSLIGATLEDNPFKDNWAHLVITYQKSEDGEYYIPAVHINGEHRYEYDKDITSLTRAFSDLGVASDGSYGYWIGRTQWSSDSTQQASNPEFKGKMDEIRLYDRVLSHAEIMELFNAHKPSDVPVDYESMPQMKISMDEDVELSGKFPSRNMENVDGITGEAGTGRILVSSNNGSAYTRYALMRTSGATTGEMTSMANCEKAVLSVYVTLVDNWGSADEFYCYGLTGDNTNWDKDTVTFENYSEQLGGSISDLGVSEVGELLDTQIATGQSKDFYMQWDVTDFVRENAAKDFSFLLTCGSNVAYIYSLESEQEGKTPELIIYQQGTPITVKRVDSEGNTISTSTVYGVMGEEYTYSVADTLISHNNTIYAVNLEKSDLTVETVTGEDLIVVEYDKAENVTQEEVNVRTYVDKSPSLPRVLSLSSGDYSALFAVSWDSIDAGLLAETGVFEITGTVLGTDMTVSAVVTVFPEYNGSVGGDLTITIYKDGVEGETLRVERSYGSVFTLAESYQTYLGALYEFDRAEGSVTAIGESIVMNQLGQHIDLYYTMKEEVEGTLTVRIKADNFEESSYTLTAAASVLNTEKNDETVKIVIADYNTDGEVTGTVIESTLAPSRTGEKVSFSKSLVFDKEKMANSVVYLWTGSMEPICDEIKLSDVKVEGYMGAEVEAMIPTYERALAAADKANTFWQSYQSYDNWYGGTHPAFWDKAAYHTGNIEYFKLTGDDKFLKYTIDWAKYNNWMGNDNTSADPSQWTWGYNQTQGSNAVLFGDWQTCFQTYIDLYNFNEQGVIDLPEASIDRVLYVMDYQISKENDDFWWWGDALYMVMPVLSKLYARTGDEKYLDALYKYFRYAKELMYDGPGGIPTSAEGYTTSAALKSGAQYSDPDDYKYLFYRDGGYVFPLNPNSGHADEKNFWARANGWIFAGLAKVLQDMPETYEHYDEFYKTFVELAGGVIACQQTDDSGYGFWTQSMLQDYPKGSNGNDEGYETSGTAFLTYALFWGINNGILDEETYLEPTLRAWGYLENVALQSDGKVGYVQPIGSNATQATPASTTVNFGVGAYLLASCEAARWAEAQ